MKLLIIGLFFVSSISFAEDGFVEYSQQELVCGTETMSVEIKTQKENCKGELKFGVWNEEFLSASRTCETSEEDFSFMVEFGKEKGGKYNQYTILINNGTETLLGAGHLNDLVREEDGVQIYNTEPSFYRFPTGDFMNGPNYMDVPCEMRIKR
jgi:hypothetical protein